MMSQQSNTKSNKEHEREMAALAVKAARSSARAAYATVGLTVVLAVIAAIQAKAMFDQNKATASAQRAFVYVSDFKSFVDQSLNTRIQTVWTNSGETPTEQFSIYTGSTKLIIADSVNELTDEFLRTQLKAQDARVNGAPVTLVGPKASVESIFIPVSSEVRAQVGHGRVMLLYGVARYRDTITGKPHVTRYCKALDFPNAEQIGYLDCRIGNCADGDCKAQGLS